MTGPYQTRIAHIRPSEVLVSRKSLSKVTEKVLNFHTKWACMILFYIAPSKVEQERIIAGTGSEPHTTREVP